jgi:hypothetical protein
VRGIGYPTLSDQTISFQGGLHGFPLQTMNALAVVAGCEACLCRENVGLACFVFPPKAQPQEVDQISIAAVFFGSRSALSPTICGENHMACLNISLSWRSLPEAAVTNRFFGNFRTWLSGPHTAPPCKAGL